MPVEKQRRDGPGLPLVEEKRRASTGLLPMEKRRGHRCRRKDVVDA